ncbi:MAG: sulfatase [Armatimonadetes bacterium]|nr:sulfatase [Armatimonadota bacterium]
MNILWLVSDTLRWDYVGCYGNDWIKTPNLDKLAGQSALFLEAYAEGLPTLPARRAIITGRPVSPARYIAQPSEAIVNYGWHPLFDQDVTAAEWLGGRGYTTAFFTDVYHMMKPGKNFHRGFDCWHWIRGQEDDSYALRDRDQVADLLRQTGEEPETVPGDHWLIQHLMNRKDWESDADTSVAQVMTTAADWLRSYTLDKPFFMWVDCFDPHEPWDPPTEDARLYYDDYEDLCGVGSVRHRTDAPHDHRIAACMKAAYAGEVTLVDRWVGHLLDTLSDCGRADDTLIVFTSDHGTVMGEQDQFGKGETRLRNQCTKVPLLIKHPDGQASGQQVSGFVQHTDILPTSLGIAGLDVPDRVLGRNIWPHACDNEELSRESIFIGWSRYCSLRTAKWNLIMPMMELREDEEAVRELYNLENDPEELNNVIRDYPEVARELADLANDYIRRQAPLTEGTIQEYDPSAAKGVRVTFNALPG